MPISSTVIIPIYIVSFLLLAYQYYRTSSSDFDFNLHFFLMLGAIGLMVATVCLPGGLYPLIFLGLAGVWLLLSIYLFRRMLRAD